MEKEIKTWKSTNEQNIGIILDFCECIKKELSELQKVIECPDTFIYDFIGRIQYELHPELFY